MNEKIKIPNPEQLKKFFERIKRVREAMRERQKAQDAAPAQEESK